MVTDSRVYDAVIVGAGQSGVPLSTALSRAGWKVALVERQLVGGSCINWGCTPKSRPIRARAKRCAATCAKPAWNATIAMLICAPPRLRPMATGRRWVRWYRCGACAAARRAPLARRVPLVIVHAQDAVRFQPADLDLIHTQPLPPGRRPRVPAAPVLLPPPSAGSRSGAGCRSPAWSPG